MTLNTAQTLQAVGFDISLLEEPAKLEKTYTVPVLFNDDGTVRAAFEIVGKNSEQYRTAIRQHAVGAIKRSVQKKQQIDGKTDEGAGQLHDLGEDRNQQIAIAVVVGAPGFMDKGQPVAVTPAFLKACFNRFPTWQDAILAALEVDANFLTI